MKKLKIAAEGEYVEKKSRFICRLYIINSFEEATKIIASQRKEFYDAKHHCSAMIIGSKGEQMRCNDDGEPSGTAGRPMLEVLKHEDLTNILCVVTRYFGGTLLGTGGLVRAYTESLKDAISKSSFCFETNALKLTYSYSYNLEPVLSRFFRDNEITVTANEYSDNVKTTLILPLDKIDVKNKLVDITNNAITLVSEEESTFLVDIK